jgi:hypothetical protein
VKLFVIVIARIDKTNPFVVSYHPRAKMSLLQSVDDLDKKYRFNKTVKQILPKIVCRSTTKTVTIARFDLRRYALRPRATCPQFVAATGGPSTYSYRGVDRKTLSGGSGSVKSD